MKRLVKFALLVGAITAAARLIVAKKVEWEGLTEDQIRARISERVPDRVPAEKVQAMTDKVVAKMRARGMLAEG